LTAVRVGFVVSKAVGNAVTRNRVKRRLRHAAVDLIAQTPPGMTIVVRALPPASGLAWTELQAQLQTTWLRAVRSAQASGS